MPGRARIALASGNVPGAEAASEVARAGGNAVDACLASAIMAWVAEPFFASIGGSGFVSVRSQDGTVDVFDGNGAMPTTLPEEVGQGVTRVYLDYSNGMYTGIGGGSIAVPGILKAVHAAWESYGRIEWAALFDAAIRAARGGIHFPRTSGYYLSVTWNEVWSIYDDAAALFGVDERPMREGELLVQEELADSLELVAEKGPEVFYEGELAGEIAAAITADGGFLAISDLTSYGAEKRIPVGIDVFGWRVESNPPPAEGGAVLTHMLQVLEGARLEDPQERLRAIIDAELASMGHPQERYQDPGQIAGSLDEALGRLGRRPGPPSSATTHTSSADADGLCCSLTQSNGYGAGLVVRGMLLNNTLGEEELNPLGAHGLPPGVRCHSNMAPTIASGPGVTVALGSPGADRIVAAIAQTFLAIAVDRMSLADAVAAPRAHLSKRPQGDLLCYEPGLPGDRLGDLPFVPRPYDEIHMFFGGVQAASVTAEGVVDAAFDPRRSGGIALV